MTAITRIDDFEGRHATELGGHMHEYLSLDLGDEAYGIDILCVQEIRGFEAPTRLAGAPAHVRGVLNLRGDIVPIIDLRAWFGLSTALTERTVTIVLNVGGRTIGAIVDAVSDVRQVGQAHIQPVPEFATGVDASCITGVTSIQEGEGERLLILLDIRHLLSGADMGLAPALPH